MVRGRFPRTAYPGVPVPFEQGTVVSSDADGEFNTVQAAIDATSSGGRVAVGPGTFSEAVTITTNDLTLVGSGRGTIIDGGTSGDAVTIDGATGVTVDGVAVQTTAGQGNEYAGIFAKNSAGGGVDESNLTVSNVIVLDSDEAGIKIKALRDSRILACRVEDSDQEGIRIDQNGERTFVSDTNVFGTSVGVGVKVQSGSPGSRLQGVYVRSTGAAGILVDANEVTMTNCTSRGAGDEGFLATGAEELYASGCLFTGSTNEDIAIEEDANNNTCRDFTLSSVGFETKNIASSTERIAINGQWFQDSIPTIDLGGADSEATPEVRNPIPTYDFFVDAGGSNSNLRGIDIQDESSNSITERGDIVWLHHTGGETVTLEHNNGNATSPLLNTSTGNEDLDANDETTAYKYDGSNWRQYASNIA